MPATSMLSLTANGTPASGSDGSISRARRTAASRSASAIQTGASPSASMRSKMRSIGSARSRIDTHRRKVLPGGHHRALRAVDELHDPLRVGDDFDFHLHGLEHENLLPRLDPLP